MASDRDTHLDIRTVDRYITRGKITREQYEAHLESLPDDADLAETSGTHFVHTRIVGPQWDDDGSMADEDDQG